MSGINKISKGNLGERLACRYLEKRGFQIQETNIHLGKTSELDIIATYQQVIHIVEVKALYSPQVNIKEIDFPIYNITPRKLQHLKVGIQIYLQKNNLWDKEIHIDAIGVIVETSSKKAWIKFFPNIIT